MHARDLYMHVYSSAARLIGMYTGDKDPDDQNLCVVEHKAIWSLCHGLVQQRCCRPRPSWRLESSRKVPHAKHAVFSGGFRGGGRGGRTPPLTYG